MIACAALARLGGVLLRAVSDGHLPWGYWHQFSQLPGGLFTNLSQMGLVVGGPLSMAFLAIGLGRVLGIQRKFHLLGSLTAQTRRCWFWSWLLRQPAFHHSPSVREPSITRNHAVMVERSALISVAH